MRRIALLLFVVGITAMPAISQTTTKRLAIADALVRNGKYQYDNYDTTALLQIKGTTSAGYRRASHIKFSVDNISDQVISAKLRLYGRNTEQVATIAQPVFAAASDSWVETSINFANQPGHGSTPLATTNVTNTEKYYEWDVTAFVAQEAAGDKVASFVLDDVANQSRLLSFNSSEKSKNIPELVIVTQPLPANIAPILDPVGNKTITIGEQLSFTATAKEPDAGQLLTFSLSSAPADAQMTASGQFSWTPSATGSFTFKVKVTDNGTPSLSDEEQITVTVEAAPNAAPVLAGIGSQSVYTGNTLRFIAAAADADAAQLKTYSIEDAPAGAVIDRATGAFEWTPNLPGEYSLKIKVTDNGNPALSDEEIVTITVLDLPQTNTAPVLDAIEDQAVLEGQALSFTASGTDADDGQTKTFQLINAPMGATIDAASGLFSWTPSVPGTYQLIIRMTDDGSPELYDEEQITIIVSSINHHAPELNTIGNQSATVGQTLQFTVQATDADASQTLRFSLIDAPSDAVLDATTGAFSWMPSASGTYSFTIKVTDNGSPAFTDEEQITITVNEINQAPVLINISDKSIGIGQQLSLVIDASDVNTMQSKTFSLVQAPPGADIDAATGALTWMPSAAGNFTFTVKVSDNGTPVLSDQKSFIVKVGNAITVVNSIADAYTRNSSYAGDNYGISDSLLVKTYSSSSGQNWNTLLKFSLGQISGTVVTAKLRLYGRNIDATDSMNIAVYGAASDGWMERQVSWNTSPAASSSALSITKVGGIATYYEWDVTAFVQAEASGDKMATLLLKNTASINRSLVFNSREHPSKQPQLIITTSNMPSNQLPVLASVGNKLAVKGKLMTFTAQAQDPNNGQNTSFSLVNAPSGAAIDAATGVFRWTPTTSGSYIFTVRATDNGSPALYDEEQIMVKVASASTTLTFYNNQLTPISNPGTTLIPVAVSGLTSAIDTSAYGLQSVQIRINHPKDSELTLRLQSPDGKSIYLFRKSPGVNIATNMDGLATKFIDNNEIASYDGAFTSSSGYRPRQDLAILNNGQNPNGTWNLIVTDDNAASESGDVIGVSLVFGPKPAKHLLTSSNLPIVKIYTDNSADILDDPKIGATMYVIHNGDGITNYANQSTYAYQGRIAIEIRGNSTATLPTIPKKQYGFETRAADDLSSVDVSFFGMPKQSDWILSAIMSDKSLMRNMLMYQIARDMGHWASRTKFCEVMINDEYRGVFVFQEKIKRDKNRVNIEKMAITDVTEPNVSGGYIFAVEDLDPGDKTWLSRYPPRSNNPFKFITPKPEDLQPAQRTYLQDYVGAFEDALYGPNFQDPENGFRKYADDKSFIDFFLVNEIAKNNDAYRYSTYFHKKRGGKIIAGPVWDFDRGMRNEATCESRYTYGYIYNAFCESRTVTWWWGRLLEDVQYKQDLVCRYNNLRQNVISDARINYLIDSAAAVLNAGAQQRNFTRWNVWGKYVERIPTPYATSYAVEVDTLRNWLTRRLAWLDGDLGTCAAVQQTSISARNAAPMLKDAVTAGNVYPSPFQNRLYVAVSSASQQQVSVRLTDAGGKVVYQKTEALQKGYQVLDVDVSNVAMSKGVYLLHITGANVKLVRKVLKE